MARAHLTLQKIGSFFQVLRRGLTVVVLGVLNLIRGTPKAAVRTWRGLPKSVRAVIQSLLIAISIEAVIHHYAHTPILEAFQDRAVDWMVALYRNAAPKRPEPIPFTVLDIDSETYKRWGEPLFTPRDKLARVIETALVAGPAALFVDVELSTRSGTFGDEVLWDLMKQHSGEAPENGSSVPPLLLPRSFRISENDPDTVEGQIPVEKESFLDSALYDSKNVFWASPLFQMSGDGSIRRWRLWEAVRSNASRSNTSASVVPSVQLMTAALVDRSEGLSSREVYDDMQCVLLALATGAAVLDRHQHTTETQSSPKIQVGEISLSAFPSRLNQRIVFRYPGPRELRSGETYPVDPATGRSMLTVVPAYLTSEELEISPELFRDRIVIIGGSYPESRDIHRTPLGSMPGAYVLVNAMDSLFEYGEMRGLDSFARYAIVIALVVAFAVLFAWFGSGPASYLAATLILITLLPLSAFYFREGYWIDFALPLIGVLIHRRVSEAEEAFHWLKGRGWKIGGRKADD